MLFLKVGLLFLWKTLFLAALVMSPLYFEKGSYTGSQITKDAYFKTR